MTTTSPTAPTADRRKKTVLSALASYELMAWLSAQRDRVQNERLTLAQVAAEARAAVPAAANAHDQQIRTRLAALGVRCRRPAPVAGPRKVRSTSYTRVTRGWVAEVAEKMAVLAAEVKTLSVTVANIRAELGLDADK